MSQKLKLYRAQIMGITIYKPSTFILPKNIERRWNITNDVICYWVYWSPFGDECIVSTLRKLNGSYIITSGDSDWLAYLELKNLNAIMSYFNLGSSDEEPEYCLLVDNVRGGIYIAPIIIDAFNHFNLLQLIGYLRKVFKNDNSR